MSIDNAILDLGGLSGVRAIDSDLSDPPATLAGDLTGNTVNVPKAGFVFPTKTTEVSPGITANIDMEANSDITGTFDSGTGEISIDASLKATVAVLGSNCVISPIELTLSSSNAHPYLGQAFTSGIEGNGVISASWTGLPPVTGGGSCGVVAGLIAGPGGIAMSHGVRNFQTCDTDPGNPLCGVPIVKPTAAPKIVTSPPASTTADVASFSYQKGDGETSAVTGFECVLDGGAPQACGSGDSGSKTYTGLAEGSHTFQVKATNEGGAGPAETYTWEVAKTPPPPLTAKFGALSVKPKAKKVKRGKRVTIVAKVRNTGDGAASGVKICVTAPKKLVRVKRCVNKGALAAGATATAKFKVVVNRKAKKGRKAALRFVATGKDVTSGNALAKKSAKAVVRIG
ncbi:MAG: hypothetical protein J0H98_05540 [Solirubrobacterales bacterium]|nr:hypothetical protein [Solirubrobacterales bacterium]